MTIRENKVFTMQMITGFFGNKQCNISSDGDFIYPEWLYRSFVLQRCDCIVTTLQNYERF